MRSKKTVYTVATLVAMFLFLPFQNQPWGIYLGVCAGYTILVFGLRRMARLPNAERGISLPAARIALVHSIYLAIVIGWVWLLLASRPYVPYILRTEDSSRPYFGLIFLGVLGVLGVEYFEQRHLRSAADDEVPNPTGSK